MQICHKYYVWFIKNAELIWSFYIICRSVMQIIAIMASYVCQGVMDAHLTLAVEYDDFLIDLGSNCNIMGPCSYG